MQILIPIATRSAFFPENEFYFPKPLIEIYGRSMISWVVDNLRENIENSHFTFVINKNDSRRFSIGDALKIDLGDKAKIIEKNKETSGALCSSLLAIDSIDHTQPLLISNCDQYFDCDISSKFEYFFEKNADAGVLTFPSVHPRWSYIIGQDGLVTQTFEKIVASKRAIAGVYYFKRAGDFFKHAENPILHNVSLDSNFYISSVLNEFILNDKNVVFSDISASEYHSFYAPSAIKNFERILIKRGD